MWFRIRRLSPDDAGGAGGDSGTGGKTFTEAEVAEREKGLKASQQQLLDEVKKLKGLTKAYEGLDPEKARTALATLEEAERKKATAEGDFKALEKQLIERHTNDLALKDKAIGKLSSALERRLKEANLATALSEAGVKAGMANLLVLEGSRYIQVREQDDDFAAVVVDDKGNPRIADGQATPMTVQQLVEQVLKAKYPDAFQGTGSSGGGATGSTAGGGGGQTVVARGDNKAFLANLDAIADGKAVVR